MHVFRKQTCFCSKFKMPWPSLPLRILEDFGPKINPCVASVAAAWEWEKLLESLAFSGGKSEQTDSLCSEEKDLYSIRSGGCWGPEPRAWVTQR